MAGPQMKVDGMKELMADLRKLPEALTDHAVAIVRGAAEGAKRDIVADYPEVSGGLKRGVRVKVDRTRTAVAAVVESRAPHAHLYEFGSQVRHTDIGANRGAMPPRPTVVPIAIRHRRAMYGELADLLVQHGFQVTGDV